MLYPPGRRKPPQFSVWRPGKRISFYLHHPERQQQQRGPYQRRILPSGRKNQELKIQVRPHLHQALEILLLLHPQVFLQKLEFLKRRQPIPEPK